VVKIELLDQHGQSLNVEMSHERFRRAPLESGREVFLSLRKAKVFSVS
jgi:hypothetical protein